MATYKELHGIAVQDVSSDPTTTGEIFYNSSTDTFRSVVQLQAWHSGTNMAATKGAAGAGGTASSAFSAGGTPGPTNLTIEWNGLGYEAGGNITQTRDSIGGAGTGVPAGLIFGGNPGGTTTELYNGTSWTNGPSFSVDLYAVPGTGTYTAALKIGGYPPAGGLSASTSTEEWGGSSWTTGGAMPSGRFANGTAGTSTAGLAFGGTSNNGPTEVVTAISYDGSSWTSIADMNLARIHLSGFGTQTAAVAAGGQTDAPASPTQTETWDGTSWAISSATLASGGAAQSAMRVGTSTRGVVAGGYNPSISNATQIYDSSTNVVTSAAWASGNNMPGTFFGFCGGGVGTQTASLSMGGNDVVTTINKYDGSSWTANPSGLNTGRRSGASFGTQTAALMAGGYLGPPGAFSNATEEFDGSSASAQNTMPYSASNNFGFGTQTAAAVSGGYAPPFPSLASTNAEYDGTNWTAATALPAARGLGGSAGQAQTTGLIWAGLAPGAVNTTLEYDGTNWTSAATYGESKSNVQGWGDQTSAIGAGGETSGDSTNTFVYDGTTWATQPSLPGARKQAGTGGTSSASGLIFGGETPPVTNTTIEFTGETTAVNVKTITTS